MTASKPIFDDGKDPQAFRTIGEVAAALAIKPHVLRYWETQFPMLSPVKRSGNRRYYRPEDVALLQRIDRLLNREGYTIRGAAKAIVEQDRSPEMADDTDVLHEQHPVAGPITDNVLIVEKLRAMRETLAALA